MIATKCFVFRFSDIELREDEFRATRAGHQLDIEPKAFRVLVYLVKHAGHLVSKSELMDAVWGETAVTENSLTRAIALLRRVLEDDPHQPHFIETVSTAGYRFICVVETEEPSAVVEKVSAQVAEVVPITTRQSSSAQPGAAVTKPRSLLGRGRWPWVTAAAVLAALGILATAWWEWWSTPVVPHVTSIEAITHDGFLKDGLVTDGSRVYFSEQVKQHFLLAQVSVAGGEASIIGTPFERNLACDVSPDKTSLLVSELHWNESSPLWVVPLPEGAPRRVGNLLADYGAWIPDGSHIVFVKGKEIWGANADGSEARKLLTVPGIALAPKVSPDGKRVRFTVRDQSGWALWEAKTDGSGAHPLLPGWQEAPSQFAGPWTLDGRYYVFGVGTRNGGDLWLLPEHGDWFPRRRTAPVQLTRGPHNFYSQVAFSPDGRTLFAAGVEQRGELIRYEATTRRTVSYLSGISATFVAFSPDGQWVTYVTFPEFSLWRSRTDGTDRFQLTSPPGYAGIARWSPDGRRIAFEWTPPGKTLSKLALISSDGGSPEEVISDSEDGREQIDPAWSPDGKEIIFSRAPGRGEVERIELLRVDLRTRKVTPVPGSEGLYGPRWSPDGHYLTADSLDSRSIRLFDFKSQVWTTWFTAQDGHVGWTLWSQDSRALYFATDKADHITYWRVGLGSQTPIKIADLPGEPLLPYFEWPTLAPDGGILYTRDLSTYEIYALHLSEK